MFCWGNTKVSKIIEDLSGGPSHVLKIWLPWPTSPWLTLEATFPSKDSESNGGVHIGMFSDYVDGYAGDLVLCRRSLTEDQIQQELNFGFSLLDYDYNWKEEVSIAFRKLIPFAPVVKPKKELYCSGLQQVIAEKTIPFKTYGPDWNTPEQDFIDPTVTPVCALLGKEKDSNS